MNKSSLLVTQRYPTNTLDDTPVNTKETLSHALRGPVLCHPSSYVGFIHTPVSYLPKL